MICSKLAQNHVFKGFWDDLEAGIGISIKTRILDMGSIFFLMDSKFSEFSPQCTFFSSFKRFSKSRQKGYIMAKTEATVTSGVKNLYTYIFFYFYFFSFFGPGKCQVVPKQCNFSQKWEFFDFKVFRSILGSAAR